MHFRYGFPLVTALAVLTTHSAQAQRRLVPQQYASIQAAIRAAQPHDTVLVSPGVYHENLRFGGKNVLVASQLLLNRQNLSLIAATIIDGSQPHHPDTASVALFVDGEDSTAMLFGFTLRGGNGTRWRDPHSPGTFREGGAILAQNASPTIRFNHIVGNQAMNATGLVSAGGGGIRVDGGQPRILNNVIVQNQGRYGGGVVINYSGAILKNNVIAGNSGGQDFGGGGVWINGAGPGPVVMENNTIVGNNSALGGGGVLFYSSPGASVFRNNIVWGNLANSGPQIGSVNLASPEYCDVEGAVALSGTGNLNVYPDFVDTLATYWGNSPLTDAGNPAAAYFDPATGFNPQQADPPANGTPRNDIGAYGGPGSAYLAPFSLLPHVAALPQYRFAAGSLVGQTLTGHLALVNQGTSELVIDSIRTKSGSALTILNAGNRDVSAFATDSLHFTWRVAAPGNFVDTIRVYSHVFRHGVQPPVLIRVLGVGRPNGLPEESIVVGATLFPNPLTTNGEATLTYRLAQPAAVRISLLDAVGRTIWEAQKAAPSGEQRFPVPVNGLRAGLYGVRITTSYGGQLLRLVVE